MVPSFLKDYADLYAEDPREATRQWFTQAKYGLFMHFGVYSLLERGEWVMFNEAITLDEYSKLKDQFTAEKFDADFITDLVLDAGMQYVTITARHHDSFCLFDTAETDFNSVSAPCGRDLIAELADACGKKSLGLFLYYSYGLDWRHPYYLPREAGVPTARPANFNPDYKYQDEADFRHYIDFTHAQIRELLTNYGPVAGLWFDPIMPVYHRPDMFPVEETYALVRSLQPQTLIVFKQGVTGTEDFASPERTARSLAHRLDDPENAAFAERAWQANKDKHNEVCATLTPHGWGYNASLSGQHHDADAVMAMLADARARNSNLLLNTGPLPDGSIDAEDAAILHEVGRRLRENGYPEPKLMEVE